MAMSLQQQPAISLRLGAISNPALSSFNRVSVSFPFKSIKQSILLVAHHQTNNKKCPLFKIPMFSTAQTHKNPSFLKCSNSILDPFWEMPLYDSVDGRLHYHGFDGTTDEAVSEMISKQQIGSCASALNQLENASGKLIPRKVLQFLVGALEMNKRYKDALEVYEWMNNGEKRDKFTTPARHLYLIAKAHGVSSAEEYLLKLPAENKGELYNVLLVRYAVARRVIKAESLLDEMINRGYVCDATPFSVMMLLYKEIELHEKTGLMISKMIEENISLDVPSYHIWLYVCRTKECLDKLLEHLKQRETNLDIRCNVLDSVFDFYLDLKQIEKAEECVKFLESELTNEWGDDKRRSVEGLLEMYWLLGKTGEIHRVWETHVGLREYYYDRERHGVTFYLLKLGDVEGAEKMYDEWVSNGPTNLLTSKANHFMDEIVDVEGLSEKVEPFFNKMINKSGIIPNFRTWEILAKYNIKMRRISEALSCLHKCFEGNSNSNKCSSYCSVIHDFIKICEGEGDIASRDALFSLLSEVGCKVEAYKLLDGLSPKDYCK